MKVVVQPDATPYVAEITIPAQHFQSATQTFLDGIEDWPEFLKQFNISADATARPTRDELEKTIPKERLYATVLDELAITGIERHEWPFQPMVLMERNAVFFNDCVVITIVYNRYPTVVLPDDPFDPAFHPTLDLEALETTIDATLQQHIDTFRNSEPRGTPREPGEVARLMDWVYVRFLTLNSATKVLLTDINTRQKGSLAAFLIGKAAGRHTFTHDGKSVVIDIESIIRTDAIPADELLALYLAAAGVKDLAAARDRIKTGVIEAELDAFLNRYLMALYKAQPSNMYGLPRRYLAAQGKRLDVILTVNGSRASLIKQHGEQRYTMMLMEHVLTNAIPGVVVNSIVARYHVPTGGVVPVGLEGWQRGPAETYEKFFDRCRLMILHRIVPEVLKAYVPEV